MIEHTAIDWPALFNHLAQFSRIEGPPDHVDLTPLRQAQNTRAAIALSPLFLSAEFASTAIAQVERYHRLLEKLLRLYRQEERVQDYFGFPPFLNDIIKNDTTGQTIDVCRFDSYISSPDQQIRILEHNSDSPAGTYFTSVVTGIGRKVLAASGIDALETAPLESATCFLEALLLRYAKARPGQVPKVIAILQFAESVSPEIEAMCAAFTDEMHECISVDPRQLEFCDTGIYCSGKKIDLVWNKVNIANWNGKLADDEKILLGLAKAINANLVVHLNGFGSRYVTESKLSLAILHEPFFRDHLADEDTSLIDQIAPWAVRMERGKRVEFEGAIWQLEELLEERQNQLVIKQHYDIRGDGVTIGRSVARSEWKAACHLGLSNRFVLQRYVEPVRIPVAIHTDRTRIEVLKCSLDFFIFNGAFAGFGAKASEKDKVNLFQGGTKLPVHRRPADR